MSTHQNLEVLSHQLSTLEKRVGEAEKRATEAEMRVAKVEGLVNWLDHNLEAEKEARTSLKQTIEAEFTKKFLALENKIGTIWNGMPDRFKGAEAIAINIDKSQKAADESMKNYNKRVNNLERFINNKLRKMYKHIGEVEKKLDPADRPRPSSGP